VICSSTAVIPRFDQPGRKADRKPTSKSSFGNVDESTVQTETGSDQPAAMACSAVERHGKLAFDDTASVPVDSPHNAPETCERLPQFKNILTPPPEGVSLLGERPRRLDSGMDEGKTAILCESGVPERREQRSMT
jgi:hypothetical protein